MLPRNHPDRIQIAFDDHRLVANAGLILPATIALPQLLRQRLDLGNAPGRANTGDKMMTLVASAPRSTPAWESPSRTPPTPTARTAWPWATWPRC